MGAFIVNALLWSDPQSSKMQRADAERDMRDAMPAMYAMGLFDVFTIQDAKLCQILASDS
ncbi:hypothetical protein PCA20602_03287 [Pandoraea capi]|uniref:Uncharacterized protein n=1 Tax=Pandoraea capi TaxID=2508286 RepID=A0ABY6W445_9BURK|nr:hypothetical protein PCA20602_03287 [Pandoraea capi]